jgi:hypothetical protein
MEGKQMMKCRLIAAALAIVGLVFMLDSNIYGGREAVSISVIMKKAMKGGGLIGKVDKGTATPEEKKEFIALLTDLAAHKPPKGDETSWREKTKALLEAAKADNVKALNKAADCKGCHSMHK